MTHVVWTDDVSRTKFAYLNLANPPYSLPHPGLPVPQTIIFQRGHTIVIWKDGTKTHVSLRKGDTFSKEEGYIYALAKKLYGGRNPYLRLIDEVGIDKE